MSDDRIWEEPVRGGTFDPRLFGLSGLEQLRAFLRMGGPIPPVGRMFGIRFTEVGPGLATFTMPASPWFLPPAGVIPQGVLCVLCDAPLGSAIQTGLPPATAYTTSELSLNTLRPALPSSGTLVARGRLVMGGQSLALSEVTVEDSNGKLLAHGTTRCFIFPPVSPAPPPPDPADLVPPVQDDVGTDPTFRTVVGGTLPQSVWDELTGLEIMQRCVEGTVAWPPIYHLCGIRPTDAEEGSATFVLPASGWLASPTGNLQGGTIAMLADFAMASAVQTTLPEATAYAPFDLKVNFLRPVRPSGGALTAVGTVVHRGRTIAVTNAEVTDPDGKRVALATSTAMILPGRPASVKHPVVPAEEAPSDE
jgi:uncharacterized protein (TIGR00369 family)